VIYAYIQPHKSISLLSFSLVYLAHCNTTSLTPSFASTIPHFLTLLPHFSIVASLEHCCVTRADPQKCRTDARDALPFILRKSTVSRNLRLTLGPRLLQGTHQHILRFRGSRAISTNQ
jgi:hypothetical protein